MGEVLFSLVPAEIPARKRRSNGVTSKPTLSYKDKDVNEWSWKDFLDYWDYMYREEYNTLSMFRSKKDNPKYKSMIQPSLDHWGNSFFKRMIDWAFANRTKYPKWDMSSMSLVCGSHGWVELISNEVSKLNKSSNVFIEV